MANTFCEHCGASLEAGSRFCESCGHSVDALESTPAVAQKTARNSLDRQTLLMIGAAVILFLVVLLAFIMNPGNIFKREPKEEPPVAAAPQDAPGQQDLEAKPESPQDQISPPVIEITPSQTSEPISMVNSDPKTFYCINSDGPVRLTITTSVNTSIQELSLRWRLNTKKDGKTTEWEGVYMIKSGSNQFSYTFDADVWEGTNNFYYPPMLGESWFEYQIFLPDGSYQTEIFKNVTFFPCAQ